MAESVSMGRVAPVARYALALAVLGYGVYSSGLFNQGINARWIAFALLLHAVPLLAQLVRSGAVRIYGLWFGVFLVVQALGVLLLPAEIRHLRTLPADMDERVDVRGDGIPGIGGVQHVTTDSKGFRAVPPVDYARKRGYRIFAIGGSTTEQILLDDEATWTHLLRQGLERTLGRPVEVINTGVAGLRAIHHLATLKHVLDYQPDMALFLVGVNDWVLHIRQHFGSRHYHALGPDGHIFRWTMLGQALNIGYMRLKRWVGPPGAPGETRVDRGEYFASQRNSLGRPEVRSFRPAAVTPAYARQLAEISTVCHEAGLVCVFITQPSGYVPEASEAFRRSFWATPPNEPYTLDFESLVHIAELYNDFLVDFADRNGHAVIDLAAVISPGRENYYDEVHFNTRGSRYVANYLVQPLGEVIARGRAAPAEAAGGGQPK